jgi:hypothetical protein
MSIGGSRSTFRRLIDATRFDKTVGEPGSGRPGCTAIRLVVRYSTAGTRRSASCPAGSRRRVWRTGRQMAFSIADVVWYLSTLSALCTGLPRTAAGATHTPSGRRRVCRGATVGSIAPTVRAITVWCRSTRWSSSSARLMRLV